MRFEDVGWGKGDRDGRGVRGCEETRREGKGAERREGGARRTDEKVGCLSIGACGGGGRSDICAKNWGRGFWLAREVGVGEGCIVEICDVLKGLCNEAGRYYGRS